MLKKYKFTYVTSKKKTPINITGFYHSVKHLIEEANNLGGEITSFELVKDNGIKEPQKTTTIRKELALLGKQRDDLDEKIEKNFYKLYDALPLLDDDHFWELLRILRNEFREDHKTKITNVKNNIDNFIIWGGERSKIDIIESIRFLITYDKKVSALYDALSDSEVSHYIGSDDGFGDMVDSFPLFGRRRYERALKGKPLAKNGDPIESIELGENYISSTIRKEILERVRWFHKVGNTEDE